jgi:hypothetical protein
MPSFDEWFQRAMGNDPFPYQRRFAEDGEIPELVDVPYWPGQDRDGRVGVAVAEKICGGKKTGRRHRGG